MQTSRSTWYEFTRRLVGNKHTFEHNAEVVANAGLGTLVPFGQPERLTQAIADAFTRDWDRDAIVAYAESKSWERRVRTLVDEFAAIAARHAGTDVRQHSSPAKPLLRS